MELNQMTDVQNGGAMTVPPVSASQLIYLDFDGELTSYNGEILTVDNVAVEDSGLTDDRIAQITASLNRRFAGQGVEFVSSKPASGSYSTIYVGKTASFAPYGNFAGLAETVDSGNKISNDNAFVMLDSLSSNEQIADVIAHEAGHLLGTLDHGGEGLEKYQAKYIVSSGVTSDGVIITGGNSMYVQQYGTATNTTVNDDAYLHISSGGTALNVKENGGAVTYDSQAIVTYVSNSFSSVTVNSRAATTVHSGTTANKTTVLLLGSMFVYDGGVANSNTVNSAGSMFVYGGITTDNDLSGLVRIYSGAVANGNNVRADGVLNILEEGSASDVTVHDDGYLYVSSGASALGIKENGGAVFYDPDAIVSFESNSFSSVTVNSRAATTVHSGTTANKTTVLLLGSMFVYDGGVANSNTVNSAGSMFVYGGITTDNDLSGLVRIYSGAVANGNNVRADGVLNILEEGSASDVTVHDDGYLYVSSGASALGIKENGGAVFYDPDAVVSFESNSFSSVTVNSRAATTVHSGTTANKTTVRLLGSMFVYDGGVANSNTVNSAGSMFVYGGITTDNDLSGLVRIYSGAVANGNNVRADGVLNILEEGSASDVTVHDDGYLYVSSGASALGIKENGGAVFYDPDAVVSFESNSFSSVTVNSRAAATVHSGTTANKTTVRLLGSMFVYDGGVANSNTVNSAGSMYVYDGGTINDTTLNGFVRICSGAVANGNIIKANGVLDVLADASTSDTTVHDDGYLYVSSGAVALGIKENGGAVFFDPNAEVSFGANSFSNVTVNSRAATTVHSGTTANKTTVLLLGSMFVYDGGVANSNTVNSAGSMYVYDGGTINDTTLNGFVRICSGAVANGNIIKANGVLDVLADASTSDTTVHDDGYLYVSSGAVALGIKENGGAVFFDPDAEVSFIANSFSNVTVNSRAAATVHSGTTANKTTVLLLGSMFVYNGGVANINTIERYGSMYVYSGGTIAGKLKITSGGVVSVAKGAVVDFTVADQTMAKSAIISNWSWISGRNDATYTVTVKDDQAEGTYVLAEGAADFANTVTVKTATRTFGTLAVDETKTFGGVSYTLAKDTGKLTLSISGTATEAAKGDLDGNGLADIVMSIDQSTHPANGATGAWLIQDNQTPVWGDLSTRNDGWSILGTGWTSAGKTTADIYIKNTGNIVGAWVTDSQGKVSGWETIGEFGADAQISGLGDFNGDGKSDLLLRNTNGAVGCFLTDGTGWNYFQSLGDEWKLCGIGDLNGDGRDDVVLKHDAGFAGTWLTQADGTVAWADLDTLQSGFEIVGCGDFNGDGVDDVLLQNGSYFGAWIVQNGSVSSWMGLGEAAGTVEQIADFNADGKDDLRIRTSGGDLGTLLVNGADSLTWKYYGSVGSEWNTSLASL